MERVVVMAQARVVILHETKLGKPDDWNLCFQYCRYEYADHTQENGYRFIWRRPDGSLQGARGQARIPSLADIQHLTAKALAAGWGNYNDGNFDI